MQGAIRQKGYLTVFASFFLIALVMVTVMLHDAGRLVQNKTRLQQVADATAYSAAVMQARELNFHAHMNRAMVANQVAIGQMVALSSYLQNNQQILYNVSTLSHLLKVHPIGAAISSAIQILERVSGAANFAVQHIGSGISFAADLANAALSAASAAWHLQTVSSLLSDIPAVVTENDPDIQLNWVGTGVSLANYKDWSKMISRYSVHTAEQEAGKDRERLDEFRDITMRSRDGFTASRRGDFLSFSTGVLRFKFRQYGGSYLGAVPGKTLPYYGWTAVDTMSFWGKLPFRGWREGVPLGWGRQATYHQPALNWRQTRRKTHWSKASSRNKYAWKQVVRRDNSGQAPYFEGPQNDPLTHIGHFKVSETGRNEGFGRLGTGAVGGEIQGLRSFMDLTPDNDFSDPDSPITTNASTPINILLELPVSSTGERASRVSPWFSPEAGNDSPQTMLYAKSAAHAVFEAPWEGSKASSVELGNLYNPFWVPRLTQSTGLAKRFWALASEDAL